MSYEVDFLMRGYYQIGPVLPGDRRLVLGCIGTTAYAPSPATFWSVPGGALMGYDLASRRPIGKRLRHRHF